MDDIDIVGVLKVLESKVSGEWMLTETAFAVDVLFGIVELWLKWTRLLCPGLPSFILSPHAV